MSSTTTLELVDEHHQPAGGTLERHQSDIGLIEKYWEFANRISQTEFAQNYRGRPEALFACFMRGHEVGLQPLQSVDSIDVIEGKPTLKPEVMRAIIRANGHDYEWGEKSNERAVIKAHRRGWAPDRWSEFEFTIDDARRMGLTNKSNWQKQPKNMLMARVTSMMGRAEFSDVLRGLSYTPDEILDTIETRIVEPEPAQPAPIVEVSKRDIMREDFRTLSAEEAVVLKNWWKVNLPTGESWPAKTFDALPDKLIDDALDAIATISAGAVPDDLNPNDDGPGGGAPVPTDDAIVDAEIVPEVEVLATANTPPAPVNIGGELNRLNADQQEETLKWLRDHFKCSPMNVPAEDVAEVRAWLEQTYPPPPPFNESNEKLNPRVKRSTVDLTARSSAVDQDRLSEALRDAGIIGPERQKTVGRILGKTVRKLDSLTVGEVQTLLDYLNNSAQAPPLLGHAS